MLFSFISYRLIPNKSSIVYIYSPVLYLQSILYNIVLKS